MLRRILVLCPLVLVGLALAGSASASCREVWVRDGGPGAQVRKQKVCSEDSARPDLEWRVRQLERHERRRSERDSRERWDGWERLPPPVIVLPPPDRD